MSNSELPVVRNEDVSLTIEDEKVNGFPSLEPKAKLFVHEFVATMDIRKASKKLGIEVHEGQRLLKTPLVAAYLDWATENDREYSVLRREWLELEWMDHLEISSGKKEHPLVDRDGVQMSAMTYNHSAVSKILTEMSKMAGMQKPEDTGKTGGVNINIDLGALGVVEDIPKVEIIDQT